VKTGRAPWEIEIRESRKPPVKNGEGPNELKFRSETEKRVLSLMCIATFFYFLILSLYICLYGAALAAKVLGLQEHAEHQEEEER
jgi:hypothetical protein